MESLRFGEMKLMIRTRWEIRFQILCSIAKSEIWISRSNVTLEFVPEEARLLIADEGDQFFFSDQMDPADVSRLQQPGF